MNFLGKFNKNYILSGLFVVLVASGFFYFQNKNEEFHLITDETEMTKFVMTHTQEELDEYYKKVDELKASDTYGGETPEETLQMYIDALKEGDLELASKYFDWVHQNKEFVELEGLTLNELNNYISFIDVDEKKVFCDQVFERCDIEVFYEGEDILIARLIKIEQSGLWKLRSL